MFKSKTRQEVHKVIIPVVLLMVSMSDAMAHVSGKPDSSVRVYTRLDIAYIFGAQVYNDNFLYNPGFNFYGAYGIFISEKFSAGMGTGLQYFKNEKFIPVFIDLTGHISKKKNTRTLSLQCGYSVAWSNALRNFSNSRLNGGVYLNAGFGRQFYISEGFAIILHISYRHQFAEIEYEIFDQRTYRERINYDMLVIGSSFKF